MQVEPATPFAAASICACAGAASMKDATATPSVIRPFCASVSDLLAGLAALRVDEPVLRLSRSNFMVFPCWNKFFEKHF
jgi:hypothetical protein